MRFNFKIEKSDYKSSLLNCLILKSTLLLNCILLTGSLAFITSSHSETNDFTKGGTNYKHYPHGGGMRVSATFGPDGRLWRIVPEKEFIYVDYSTDLGKTFSVPVQVNKKPQRITVSKQNRPDIVVDHSGRIIVIYTAKIARTTTLLISISDDNGSSFSMPMTVSKKASEAISFLGRLAISPSGKVYIFWLDERDRTDWRESGYSIYSVILNNESNSKLVNYRIAESLCECCRIAAAFDSNNQPVLFTRFIYPDNIRDHGLIRIPSEGEKPFSWRVTFDQWKIRGCPEHGPAISINEEDQYHIAWFSQGSIRQGLFYAYSSDKGKSFSNPLAFGVPHNMPGYPDILAIRKHVYLTWKEFDGTKTKLLVMMSENGGRDWLSPRLIAESSANSDIPILLSNAKKVFVSWKTKEKGYLLIPLD